MKLIAHPVTTDDELQEIRRIRNLSRQWMTENSAEISASEQRTWWKLAQAVGDCYLYAYRMSNFDPELFQGRENIIEYSIIGYSLVTLRQGLWYVSLAIDPSHRGLGHGTSIYKNVSSFMGDEDLYAVILKNNIASIKAAEKAGFRFVEDGAKTVLYVRTK